MNEQNATASEQLDALLSQGKISQQDYDTLHKAMEERLAEDLKRREKELAPRLWRSGKNRYLGGVCAGLGERFGIDAWKIRLIALLLLLVMWPLTVIVYVTLWLVLPWDEPPQKRSAISYTAIREQLSRLTRRRHPLRSAEIEKKEK